MNLHESPRHEESKATGDGEQLRKKSISASHFIISLLSSQIVNYSQSLLSLLTIPELFKNIVIPELKVTMKEVTGQAASLTWCATVSWTSSLITMMVMALVAIKSSELNIIIILILYLTQLCEVKEAVRRTVHLRP